MDDLGEPEAGRGVEDPAVAVLRDVGLAVGVGGEELRQPRPFSTIDARSSASVSAGSSSWMRCGQSRKKVRYQPSLLTRCLIVSRIEP